ncbi:MAG: FG-GAP repeat protein [Candidatus Aminicenantales bacterium]
MGCHAEKSRTISFAEVPPESGLFSFYGAYSSTWGDFNGDGYPDVLINRHRIAPLLYFF